MGATNSKPQTVQMVNPAPFQVTADVVQRIERATKVGDTPYCENCKRQAVMHTQGQSSSITSTPSSSCSTVSPDANSADVAVGKPSLLQHQHNQATTEIPFQRRSSEIEETQFSKTLDRVNKLFGNPVKWAKECSGDIENLENELIACYKEYGSEPLQCAGLAKRYHGFVFGRHFEAMREIKPMRQENEKEKKK
ncbi:uncharacterized protein LOC115628374 [Scaptodrosophila lebanonensis]|uniref:Uncharacterized protein LOC115628374 n=1 Tax=Drosophila lebanonensis TaxID=7225 RepID=A0A6J2TZQ7_DROLE|nr:uncharacterized protein LOC115628374 [Scaptodrosophila lebanonensis]